MPDIQKVSVALTGEQIAALKAAVETGEYATTSEIIREALRDWQFKRELRQEDIKRLRKMWKQGKASGPAEPLAFAELRREARKRLKQATRYVRMKAKLIWSPQAREDLLEIYIAIGLDNPDAAERLYTAMESKAALLGAILGSEFAALKFMSARILIEGTYLILYETHPDTDEGPVESVEIVRVVDGRRDLASPF